eukprot:834478-Prymnesium_polylepis.1
MQRGGRIVAPSPSASIRRRFLQPPKIFTESQRASKSDGTATEMAAFAIVRACESSSEEGHGERSPRSDVLLAIRSGTDELRPLGGVMRTVKRSAEAWL